MIYLNKKKPKHVLSTQTTPQDEFCVNKENTMKCQSMMTDSEKQGKRRRIRQTDRQVDRLTKQTGTKMG